MRAIIIEDEEHARANLCNLLENYCPAVEVIAMAETLEQAERLCAKFSPELIFLDIELPDGNGFSLLEKITAATFFVIFTTAHDRYAIQAIKFSALDYLLKPIDADELKQAVDKALKLKEKALYKDQVKNLMDQIKPGSKKNRLSISTNEGINFIDIDSIIRCEAEAQNTHFFLKDGQHLLVQRPLTEFEEILPGEFFLRVHRMHLINLSCIEKYLKGEEAILMNDGNKVEVAARKKTEVLERILHQHK